MKTEAIKAFASVAALALACFTILAALGLFTAVSAHAEEWLTLRPQDLAQYEITQANTVCRLDGVARPT